MAKYARGERITDPLMALALILDGHVVFWNHKAQNAAWLNSMQLNVIVAAVRKGIIYRAVEREKADQP